MEVLVKQEEETCIIELNGCLDYCSSEVVEKELEQLTDQFKKHLLVNCHGVKYLSSTALEMFLLRNENFRKSDIKLVLFGVREKLKPVFNILGLEDLLPIFNCEHEARAYLAEQNNY